MIAAELQGCTLPGCLREASFPFFLQLLNDRALWLLVTALQGGPSCLLLVGLLGYTEPTQTTQGTGLFSTSGNSLHQQIPF